MEQYQTTSEIRRAINRNIENITKLVESAKKMQSSISNLEDDQVKAVMNESFNNVIDAINGLMVATKHLFDSLDEAMEE